jgi:hypothetical protein
MPEATATTTEAPAAAPAKAPRKKPSPLPEPVATGPVPAQLPTGIENNLAVPLPPGCGPTLAALTALDAAIALSQSQFGTILRDADNPYFKSSYVSLPSLLALVRPILHANGVMISSSYQLTSAGFVVSTTLTHTTTGGWRVSTFPVPDPSKPQSVGAAGTYGLRLSLLQLLAISGEDDDGNAATTGAPVPNTVPVAQWGAPSTAAQPAASAPTAAPAAQAPAAWDAPAPAPGTAPQPWL